MISISHRDAHLVCCGLFLLFSFTEKDCYVPLWNKNLSVIQLFYDFMALLVICFYCLKSVCAMKFSQYLVKSVSTHSINITFKIGCREPSLFLWLKLWNETKGRKSSTVRLVCALIVYSYNCVMHFCFWLPQCCCT